MSIRLALYGLGYGKDILVPFKEQASYGKGKRYLSTYMDDENKSVSCSSKTNQF
jgi:hypothetical protein